MVLSFLALCSAATSIAQQSATSSPSSDTDSDEVYSAVVDWRVGHPGEGQTAKTLVLLDTTVQYSCMSEKREGCADSVRSELEGWFDKDQTPDLLKNFLDRNADVGPMSQTVPTKLKKFWISKADETAMFRDRNDGWRTFYQKYPDAGGIMRFSRVGFNRAHDRALLYSTISCGWLCGTGHYFLLRKESGKWVISKSQMVWIS
jgi:hypothetical protein